MNDIGSYKCKLTNNLGSAESSAKVSVKKIYHAPMFVQKLHDLDQVRSNFKIMTSGRLEGDINRNDKGSLGLKLFGHST